MAHRLMLTLKRFDPFSRPKLFARAYILAFMRLLLIFVPGLFAQAQSTSMDTKFNTPKNAMPLSSGKEKALLGYIRFENLQYMTRLEEAPELSSSQFLSGHLEARSYKEDPGTFNWAANISAGTFFSLRQSYYSVQEAFLSTPLDEKFEVTVGRRKYNWTEVDRIWSLGLWQPRYAIDALRPEDQGLTGFFFELHSGAVQFLAFASPVFIPTMGPDIREENGQLKSDNRWYRPPSSEAGNIELTYKIDTGDIWKLVQQESYGFHLRLGQEESGPWVAVAAGRKPVNDILYQRCLRCVSSDSLARFIVNPRVAHHDVASADIGYQFENLKASVSYYEDHPELLLPPEDYAIQKIFPIKAYAGQIDWDLQGLVNRSLNLQVGYLRTFGDRIQDIERSGVDTEVTLFRDRYRFSNAALFQALGDLTTLMSRPLVAKLSYIREFQQEGSILGLEFQYQWDRKWSFLAGVDLLGVDDKNNAKPGFINDYRANDRAYAGASYVF